MRSSRKIPLILYRKWPITSIIKIQIGQEVKLIFLMEGRTRMKKTSTCKKYRRKKSREGEEEAKISKYPAMPQRLWCSGFSEISRTHIQPQSRNNRWQSRVIFRWWKWITGSSTRDKGLLRVIFKKIIECFLYFTLIGIYIDGNRLL